mgnify:CR=1 FL=1
MQSNSSQLYEKVIPYTWGKHVYAKHAQQAKLQVKLDKIRSCSECCTQFFNLIIIMKFLLAKGYGIP